MMAHDLPDSWRWVKLGEVCEINPRRPRDLAVQPDDLVTFVPMAAVDDATAAITASVERPYSEISRGYTYMRDGDVIFAKITPCMQNGKHAIVSGTRGGFAFGSTEFHVLRPSPEIVPEWLHRYLLQPSVLSDAQRAFTGTAGQQRVPKDFLIHREIALPPVPEQLRTMARLSAQLATLARAEMAARSQLAALEAMPAALLRKIFPRSKSAI